MISSSSHHQHLINAHCLTLPSAWRPGERCVESYGNCSLLYFVGQDHYKSIKMRCFYTFVKVLKKLHTSVLVFTSPSVSGLPLLPVQCLALEAQHSHISPGLISSAPFLQPVSKALCYTLIQEETIMDCTSSRSQGLQPYSLPNPSHVTPNTFLTIVLSFSFNNVQSFMGFINKYQVLQLHFWNYLTLMCVCVWKGSNKYV